MTERISNGVLFAVVPEWILFHPELDAHDVRVWAALQRYAGSDGKAFPKKKTIGERVRRGETAVGDSIRALERVGALRRFRRTAEDGRQLSNDYVLDPVPPSLRREGGVALATGTCRPSDGHEGEPMEGEPVKDGSSSPSKNTRAPSDAEGRFAEFWAIYPRKTDKKRSWTTFRNLSAESQRAAIDALPAFVAAMAREKRPTDKIKHPSTWLNGENWNDELDPGCGVPPAAAAAASGMYDEDGNLGGLGPKPEWKTRVGK